ncbi:phosphonate degradation HD-domain oxygenase [Hydrogenophaga pseudoflava]|uniref:phosphonate degradation HD-domain oxygenase n=1 Tax=Hydrogenophaga pseudoflava TaxID=47421 RepID=UPI0027E56D57|nr:phosphonate degradation HD-domain oxygenase [Hydrogenophaga pseudoflava]MDQ7746282.1 phosphohydrolase [Hydrogenophaga pseudoflava]
MALNIDDIVRLLEQRGAQQYGLEAVSQREHALQCAHLAETAGEPDELVIACLLHDLGHLIAAEKAGTMDTDMSQDDLHQYTVLPFLRGVLPDAVLEPIRLHVDAKRYLCQAEGGYYASLSTASVHSLAQQGGAYTAVESRAFLLQPFAADAVRLRRYDDKAKDPARVVPPLDHYLPRLEQLMLQTA